MPNLTNASIRLIFLDFFRVTETPRAILLPLSAVCRGGSGSALSARSRLVFLLAALLTPLHAVAEARQQIDEAVHAYLAQRLQEEASRQGWQGLRFTHDSSPLSATAALPPCSVPPQVSVSGDNPSLLVRQRYNVQCPDHPGWTVAVVSQANVFLPVVHARTVIERGQTIGADQLKREELNIAKAPRGFFNDPDDVIGQGAKRRIRANQLITPALLGTPLLVRRGQRVTIVANQDGIAASAQGEALENGREGAVIRVKNLSSEKVIDAKVLEAGVVTSTFQ